MKTYKHLTKEERCLIYFLWNKEKYSMNKIAKILNKNKSTISRELKETHLQQGFIIHHLLTKNTLEENQIVICFWSTKTSQIFLFKNLILNLMV
ncbi:helix-turn-helix domain-containing protein [Malacoplasma iowae]|uniref:helix-turn-helix domain-containing protein n=1 Tax=Malacoplasma iowae TaxID=2116 RepID=UPI002A18CC1F|nr:helix-turn-helix domain-containing protein [Malacoplasma iowae]WPL36453.1 helix-turn-helix domain-containing protein [Malacoplasma iowae]WPL36914.1 helix-turn-helix domain-containing protein [Malacoplasma iowae]WPL37897.1 helix-turn-helix domain-containing protein [Malacoplasma iowae]WPL38296.1 helix-turn-helix domain-containing protein [Malacoplasma iowae]